MRRHDPHPRRGEDAAAVPRDAETLPAEASILELQRSAGNRAVSTLLSRQPAPADSRRPPAPERAATMTLGLGDDIGVIPLDSASWGESRKGTVHELFVTFADNPATPLIQQAAAQGKPIPSGFFSTSGAMSTFTDAVLTAMSMTDAGGEGAMITLTVNFETIEHKPVR